jgi:hypothetical protein
MEEMASIVLTPFVLYFSLPYCTHAILDFVRDNTVFVEGVGDICSLANFDFEKHGNSKYGALTHCPKVIVNMLLLPRFVWLMYSLLAHHVLVADHEAHASQLHAAL